LQLRRGFRPQDVSLPERPARSRLLQRRGRRGLRAPGRVLSVRQLSCAPGLQGPVEPYRYRGVALRLLAPAAPARLPVVMITPPRVGREHGEGQMPDPNAALCALVEERVCYARESPR